MDDVISFFKTELAGSLLENILLTCTSGYCVSLREPDHRSEK